MAIARDRSRGNTLQRGPRQRFAAGLERSVTAEGTEHARRDLRIELIDLEHLVCEEVIARAVRAIELQRIAQRIRTDERAHLVPGRDLEERILSRAP